MTSRPVVRPLGEAARELDPAPPAARARALSVVYRARQLSRLVLAEESPSLDLRSVRLAIINGDHFG